MVNLTALRLREGVTELDPSYSLCADLLESLQSRGLASFAATARGEGLRGCASVIARADHWFRYPPPRAGSVATAIAEELSEDGVPADVRRDLEAIAGWMVWATPPTPSRTLRFRNLEADPSNPVDAWPYEGIAAAIERGELSDWRRIADVIEADGECEVARMFEEHRFSVDSRGGRVLGFAMNIARIPRGRS